MHSHAYVAAVTILLLLYFVCAHSQPVLSLNVVLYCEILWGRPSDAINGTLQAIVSFNASAECANDPGYMSITYQDVVAVHGPDSQVLVWNGPRVFVLERLEPQSNNDGAAASGEPPALYEYGSFYPDGSGFLMRKQATLEIDIGRTPFEGGSLYSPTAVERHVTAVWSEGMTVYELVAPPPLCTVFTMQSFFIGRNATGVADRSQLAGLAGSGALVLPDGWTYRVRTLEEELRITGVDGVTNVLQDNIGNSYSQHDNSRCENIGGESETPVDSGSVSSSEFILIAGLLSWTVAVGLLAL